MNPHFLQTIIEFAAPCWAANMLLALTFPLKRLVPVFSSDRPIDLGRSFLGNRLIGDSRTYGGLVLITVLALVWTVASHSALAGIEILLTYVGTVLGSFLKRRLSLPRGYLLPIIDQADYLLLVGLVWYVFGLAEASVVAAAILVTLILHPLVCFVGYRLRLKERPY